jgi:hypothetical protein
MTDCCDRDADWPGPCPVCLDDESGACVPSPLAVLLCPCADALVPDPPAPLPELAVRFLSPLRFPVGCPAVLLLPACPVDDSLMLRSGEPRHRIDSAESGVGVPLSRLRTGVDRTGVSCRWSCPEVRPSDTQEPPLPPGPDPDPGPCPGVLRLALSESGWLASPSPDPGVPVPSAVPTPPVPLPGWASGVPLSPIPVSTPPSASGTPNRDDTRTTVPIQSADNPAPERSRDIW